MPFKPVPQKFNAKINTLTVGVGDKAITLGGENVLPFYSFDAEIENAPKVGIEISDLGIDASFPALAEFYAGAATLPELAKVAAEKSGADFLAIYLEGAHPDNGDRSVEDTAALIAEVAAVVDLPIVIEGCRNADKDAKLFEKIADVLQGKNVLFLSAREENYKAVAAGAAMAYQQKIGAESAVDINLAKQLNVLISQMGIKSDFVAMNLGSAAAGYGFEYVASTIDRVKAAALAQNDNMLQMPIITPVSSDAWGVKESIVSEEDFPEWGPVEQRGVSMEIATASACLAAGSNAVILRHPQSVATIKTLVADLV